MITRGEFFKLLGFGALLAGTRSAPAEDDAWNNPDWLRKWQEAPRIPVLASRDPQIRRLLAAIRDGGSLVVRYHGGTTPGQRRLISPCALHQIEGFPALYLTAHCHTKNQPRHFRLDLLEIEI